MRSSFKNYSDQQNCAHAWAHQLSPGGRASNFYFQGPTIYSYGSHFPIATLDGERVFFTTRAYSSSTSQHKSRARAAVSHLEIIFVEHVPVSEHPSADDNFIRKNIEHWSKDILLLIDTARKYPKRTSLYQEITACLSRLDAFIAALNITPDEALAQVLNHPFLQTIADHHAAIKQKAAEAEQKKRARLSRLFPGIVEAWRNDLSNNDSLENPEDANLVYLRWNEKTACVETSKAIHVPLEVARGCYDFVQTHTPHGFCDREFIFMGFRVNSVSSEFLTIGCHKISRAEISAIAAQLGWE